MIRARDSGTGSHFPGYNSRLATNSPKGLNHLSRRQHSNVCGPSDFNYRAFGRRRIDGAHPNSNAVSFSVFHRHQKIGSLTSTSQSLKLDLFMSSQLPSDTASPLVDAPFESSIREDRHQFESLQPLGPNNPPWGIGGAALTFLGSLALMIGLLLIFIVPYLIYSRVDLNMLERFLAEDKTAVFLQVISLLPTHILTLLLIWMIVTRMGRHSFAAMIGWEWGRGMNLWKSVGLGLLLFVVGIGIASLGGEHETPFDVLIKKFSIVRITVAILATFTAPVVEEFTYRGVIFSALQRRLGVVFSVVFVFLLFAGVHVSQYRGNYGVIAAVTVLSLVLTLVRVYSGRILACVVIHTVFNGVQSVLLAFSPQLEELIKHSQKAEGMFILFNSLLARC
jgi:membrane protease YdiL (CAAX protease family)